MKKTPRVVPLRTHLELNRLETVLLSVLVERTMRQFRKSSMIGNRGDLLCAADSRVADILQSIAERLDVEPPRVDRTAEVLKLKRGDSNAKA